MFRLLIPALLFLLGGQQLPLGGIPIPAPGITWTLIQHPHNFTCSVTATGSTQITTCTVTLSSNTVAGNGLILLSSFGNDAIPVVAPTFSSASGDSTWTHCPAQYKFISNIYGVATDCAYILSAAGGASTVTFSWTGTYGAMSDVVADAELLEIHRSTGSATFDACTTGTGCITSVTGTGARTSPSCPITGTDYVAQWIADTSPTINSISGAAYTNPFDVDNSNVEGGFAGALTQSSAPAQTWTVTGATSTSIATMSCVAFK